MISFHEYNQIFENIKQAKQYLTDRDIAVENNDVLDTLTTLLRKKPNYIGNFVKYHYEEGISLQDLKDFISYMITNKATVDKLPKNLIDYEKFEYIQDDLRVVERSMKANNLYNYLHPELRTEINKLSEYDKADLDNLVISFMDLPDDKKNAFTPLKFFRVNRKPVGDFIEKIKEFIENLDSGRSHIEEFLKRHQGKYDIVYDQDNILIVKSNDKELVKDIGSPKWCIVYAQERYYNTYLAPSTLNTHYTIFNFNYALSNRYSRFGVTLESDGKPKIGGCQDNTNTAIPIHHIAHSLSVDENVLNDILVNDFLVKKQEIQDVIVSFNKKADKLDVENTEEVKSTITELVASLKKEGVDASIFAKVLHESSISDDRFNQLVNILAEKGIKPSDYEDFVGEYIVAAMIFATTRLKYLDVKQYLNTGINQRCIESLFIQYVTELFNTIVDTHSLVSFIKVLTETSDEEALLKIVHSFNNMFTKQVNMLIDEGLLNYRELAEEDVKEFIFTYSTDNIKLDYDDIEAYQHKNINASKKILSNKIANIISKLSDYESVKKLIDYLIKIGVSAHMLESYISHDMRMNFTRIFDIIMEDLNYYTMDFVDKEYVIAMSAATYSNKLHYYHVKPFGKLNIDLLRTTKGVFLSGLIDDLSSVGTLEEFKDIMDSNDFTSGDFTGAQQSDFTSKINTLMYNKTIVISELDSELQHMIIDISTLNSDISYEDLANNPGVNQRLFAHKTILRLDEMESQVEDFESYESYFAVWIEAFDVPLVDESTVTYKMANVFKHLHRLKQLLPNLEKILTHAKKEDVDFAFRYNDLFLFEWSDIEPYITKNVVTFLTINSRHFIEPNHRSIPDEAYFEHFYSYAVDYKLKYNHLYLHGHEPPPIDVEWTQFEDMMRHAFIFNDKSNAYDADGEFNESGFRDVIEEALDSLIRIFQEDDNFVEYIVNQEYEIDFDNMLDSSKFYARYAHKVGLKPNNSIQALIQYKESILSDDVLFDHLQIYTAEDGSPYIIYDDVDDLCEYYDDLSSFNNFFENTSVDYYGNIDLVNEDNSLDFYNLKKIINYLVGIGYDFDMKVFNELETDSDELNKMNVEESIFYYRNNPGLSEIYSKVSEIITRRYKPTKEEEEEGIDDDSGEEVISAIEKAYAEAYSDAKECGIYDKYVSALGELGFLKWEDDNFFKEVAGKTHMKVDLNAIDNIDSSDYHALVYEYSEEFTYENLLNYSYPDNITVYTDGHYGVSEEDMNERLRDNHSDFINEGKVFKFKNYIKMIK
jgi:hypothetical protein